MDQGADAMTADAERSTDEVEIEIARARNRLSSTADALTAALAPSALAEKGVEMLSGLFARGSGIRLGGMRADPVAIAFVGLGLAWFVAENAGLLEGTLIEAAGDTPPPERTHRAGPQQSTPLARRAGGDWLAYAAEASRDGLHTVDGRGGVTIARGGELIAGSAVAAPRETGWQASGGRGPWLFGLIAVAAGAAIAAMLPTSRREREIASRARDQFWEGAERLGHAAAQSLRELGRTRAADQSAHPTA
jgi:hypothetical protein